MLTQAIRVHIFLKDYSFLFVKIGVAYDVLGTLGSSRLSGICYMSCFIFVDVEVFPVLAMNELC